MKTPLNATVAKPIAPQSTHGVFWMLGSVLLFTSNTLLMRAISDEPAVNGWVMSLYRAVIGILFVYLCFGRAGKLDLAALVRNPWLIARGLVGGLGIPIYYITIVELGAGRATLLNCTYPLFATIIAAVFLKEAINIKQLFWIGIALLGIVFISGEGVAHLADVNPYDLLALLGALLAGCVVVIIRHLHRDTHTSTIYAAQCLYCGLISLAPGAEGALQVSSFALTFLIAGSLLATLGQLAMTFAYKSLPVSQGASLQLALPLATAAGGVFFFGESYSLRDLIGAAFILAGCYQVVTFKKSAKC